MNLIQKLKIKTILPACVISTVVGMSSLSSCVEEISFGGAFLDKQPSVDVTIDTIFAKGENAKRFLWHMYGALHNPFTYTGAVWYSHPDALTDICQSYCSWHNLGAYYSGDLTESSQDNGGLVKFPFIANGDGNARAGIWRTIREGWLFISNIDRVPDLSESEKSQLRGEVYVIMASPLFNNDQPYLEFTRNEENQDIHQVWTGGYQPELWQKALKACEDFFQANSANGGYFALIQPTGNTEQDYCNAYRAAYWFRGNSEKLIEVHAGPGNDAWNGDWNVEGMDEFGMACFTLEYMEMFGMADGRNFPYDYVFNTDNPENIDIFVGRDPRLYETMVVNRNNLVEQYQGLSGTELWQGGNVDQNFSPQVTDTRQP